MNNKKIGLTPRFNDDGVFEVNNNYINYLINNGLSPVILDYNNPDIEDAIKSCDGFIICGGQDIDPVFYGEANTDSTPTLKEIDLLDQRIINYCIDFNKPLLGVCRGMQAMNVFLGGTLYQNITNHKDVNHYVNSVNSFFNKRFEVNSLHHQAIKDLAKGLNIIACSDDGIIEAVISDNKKMLGVQWHPEMRMDSFESKQIINYFKKMLGE